jgi:hypothetical protein
MRVINESIYLHETGGISNCQNRSLHEVLDCAPAIILNFFFLYGEGLPIEELLQNFIPYLIIE